jgi:alkyldihydroxyacetonephosphate synthase
MRRWNGWSEDGADAHVPERARELLTALVGPGTPSTDAALEDVVAAVPESRLTDGGHWDTDPAGRVLHARGQSLPDWVALRSGRLGVVPDAVARPADAAGVRAVMSRAADVGAVVIPYGGGTSVVGGVTPRAGDRPIVSVDLAGTAGLQALDETSGLATFGAGTTGPSVEAALGAAGWTLGHYPQSFERSTVGGWVVTRSAGQESTGYGRIEALFGGGHVETPSGPLDLPTHPASAAGPDLRQFVLGSEGRLGILTDVVVRATPIPQTVRTNAFVMRDWESALTLARTLAQRRLPLSMVRVATPLETATTLALVADGRGPTLLRRYLGMRGVGADRERCLVLVGFAGRTSVVEAAAGEVARTVRDLRGVGAPGVGKAWRRDRFRAPDLRDALWAAGYAVDTLETATDWTTLPDLAATLGRTLRHGLEDIGERVHAFSHLSHVYPSGSSLYSTYIFRLADDPDETLERWARLKGAASAVITAHGATITHQHGIGTDHARYLAAEDGPLGMAMLEAVVGRLDPAGLMSPGVLIGEDRP